nr:lipopolysaccharide heptosyltransferase II [Chitinivorax sp. B]
MTRILVVTPSWVGDCVMAQPLYRLLAIRYPDMELDVLAPAWTLPLHARMPEVAQALDNPFAHGQLRLLDRFRLGQQLQARQYDQAIVLPNSLKSALVPWFARIPKRTGYLGEQRYGLLNDWRRLDEAAIPRMVDRFARLAAPENESGSVVTPNPLLTADAQQVQASMGDKHLTCHRPVVAFCPGAEYGPAKRWPVAHFADLGKLAVAAGAQVWIFGSSKELEIGEAIASGIGDHVFNLCGGTSLAQAIDLLSLSRAVVTNDSGLMHVAAALGRPVLAVYGSSSPIFTPPLSDSAQTISLNVSCSPCFKRECPLGHMKCLNDLTADYVWPQLFRYLS